jgi:hypothetical protein
MRIHPLKSSNYFTVKMFGYRHAGDKGERGYSSYSFLTSALNGGKWSVPRLGIALPRGKGPAEPTGYEAGWASELICTQRLEEKSFASVWDRTTVAR